MFRIVVLTLFCAGLVAAGSKSKLKYKDQRVRRQEGECAVDQFKCSNGRCIQEEWVCDSDGDCADNSDEATPGCTSECTGPHKIKCKNGGCVPLEFRCDGDDDCGDQTDEQGCGESFGKRQRFGDCDSSTSNLR
ncbi:hypothetical protein C0Q70_15649 [Pomacea canaliculata]|uniref:Uncharacterized protein n=1 Tax=Pomacea canaliculata TaxID=400727 RepID=A0A2T7NVF6_POMCA|nr:hypothetical protein C0Q70_15649 [Pomacea canaliculata]